MRKTWAQWAEIERRSSTASAPSLLSSEPDLAIRVVRDVFNEDFASVTVAGDVAWETISGYIASVAPDLGPRLRRWTSWSPNPRRRRSKALWRRPSPAKAIPPVTAT